MYVYVYAIIYQLFLFVPIHHVAVLVYANLYMYENDIQLASG